MTTSLAGTVVLMSPAMGGATSVVGGRGEGVRTDEVGFDLGPALWPRVGFVPLCDTPVGAFPVLEDRDAPAMGSGCKAVVAAG